MALKTPGVYVQEIPLLPPSVAEVETAIPAFLGYTEKAERRGEDLTHKPTKISSLLEYHELFGGGGTVTDVEVEVDEENNYAVTEVEIDDRYFLYDSLRLFFDNGGGDCYVVSVGRFGDTVSSADLTTGLTAVEKFDEPTLLVFPDATRLASADEAQFYSLQQAALAQAARLQDRFAILDLFEGDIERSLDTSVDNFRNGVGINNLKYGAAYTPWVHTTYPRTVGFDLFRGAVEDSSGNTLDLANLTSDSNLNGLVSAAGTTLDDAATLTADVASWRSTSATVQDRYKALKDGLTTDSQTFVNLLGFLRGVATDLAGWQSSLAGTNLSRDVEAYAGSGLSSALESLVALEKNEDVIGVYTDLAPPSALDDARDAVNVAYAALDATGWATAVASISADGTDFYDGTNTSLTTLDRARATLAAFDAVFLGASSGNLMSFVAQVQEAARIHADMAETLLYQEHSIISNIVEHIKREMSRVPPSGVVAGAYAFVDGSRGVWKAPANVSLNSVLGPVVPLADADQEDLNVDVNAGKSINALRAFSGRGTVVWGARTLAGNDNEWRYVSVRRFFNAVEESIKKSTAFAVFEPNAAPLWTKVKSMISNYLVQKWREGALAGATPDDAFFVKVGLGETMTAQDILEGRMNVEISMAVVRPAEFIVLKFSHKLQES